MFKRQRKFVVEVVNAWGRRIGFVHRDESPSDIRQNGVTIAKQLHEAKKVGKTQARAYVKALNSIGLNGIIREVDW